MLELVLNPLLRQSHARYGSLIEYVVTIHAMSDNGVASLLSASLLRWLELATWLVGPTSA